MSVEAVLDTNILLYAASKDPGEAPKREIALDLLAQTNFGLPLQVLQEFFYNARAKARLAIDPDLCDRMIEALLQRPIVTMDIDLFAEARKLCRRFELGYWDAAILAATHRLGAPILYSEDLNDGQVFDGVRVVNPFSGHSLPKPRRKR